MSVYTAFSIFSDDEIIKEVYQYIAEKIYNSTTADLFWYAFSWIVSMKVVVTYADRRKEDTVIGAELLKKNNKFVQVSISFRSFWANQFEYIDKLWGMNPANISTSDQSSFNVVD